MKIVEIYGIAGGSGSGKSTVCLLFSEHGIPTVDADAVYHEITSRPSECVSALCDAFGDRICKPDGSLDRTILRKIVFPEHATPEEQKSLLERLNGITHTFILSAMREKLADLAKKGFSAALVDAPLLFESGFDRECDALIAVVADTETRIGRICARDGIPREAALARIRSQMSDEELIRRVDYILHNDAGEAALREQVEALLRKFRTKNRKIPKG